MSETEVTTEVQEVDTENLDTFAADFFGEKKAPDPAATGSEVVQGDDDTDGQVTEAQEDPDPNADPEAEFVEAPPKKKTVQDRIDELVKQREDAKRDGDLKLEQLRKEFEDKLASLNPAKPVVDKAEPQPDDLNEQGESKYPLGEFDPTYIRDLTRFTLDQETAKHQIAQAEQARIAESNAAAQQLQTSWNDKLETAKTEYPDLVEKGQELLKGFENLNENYAGYLSTVIMSMDKGPDVLYYLSNHPDEAATIVNSGAQKATLALGRIEARFMKDEVAKPKTSKAPPPPPVRARGTNGAFISVAPDTDDLDAFTTEFFRK